MTLQLVQLDPQGRVTLINRRAKSMLGLDADSALGRDWFELSTPTHEVPLHREHYLAFLGDGTASLAEREVSLTSATEALHTISWVFSRICDDSGQVTGCLCVGMDISRRIQQQERERLASMVFHQAQEAIMVCGPDRHIVQINPSFTDNTGFTAESVLGCSPRMLT